ncbi:MAG: hypothetical protein ACXACA_03440 [Candidatus Ranarchaeia archaeon]
MSYMKIDVTSWGVKIDTQGIIFVAAVTAVAFVINTMAIPIAPSLWVKFGGVVGGFVAVCNGPVWNALSGMISVAYVGIVIHGDLGGILAAGCTHFVSGVSHKFFHPAIGGFVTLPINGMIMFSANLYISGYPVALAAQIFLKRIIQAGIMAPVFLILISIPGIYKYVPMYYDSFVVRWWLLKLEEEQSMEE